MRKTYITNYRPKPRARPEPKRNAAAYKPPRKRLEFAQWAVLISWTYVFLVLIGTFILAWHEKQEMPGVDTVSISVFGGFVTGGYFTQNSVRAWSENKYGRQGRKGPDTGGTNDTYDEGSDIA